MPVNWPFADQSSGGSGASSGSFSGSFSSAGGWLSSSPPSASLSEISFSSSTLASFFSVVALGGAFFFLGRDGGGGSRIVYSGLLIGPKTSKTFPRGSKRNFSSSPTRITSKLPSSSGLFWVHSTTMVRSSTM